MSELDVLDEYTLSPADLTAKKETGLGPEDLKSNGVPKPYCSSSPSPYQTSESRSINEQDFPREASGFHNPREPFYAIQHEKAIHLNVCYLAAAGNNNLEIAEVTGYTPVAISNILRQPWARERIADIIKKSGRSEVEQLLKGAAAKAVNRLIEEVDNCDKDAQGASAQSRISASKEILDRVFGKAAQPIIHTQVDLNKLSDEELAAMLPQTDGTSVNK